MNRSEDVPQALVEREDGPLARSTEVGELCTATWREASSWRQLIREEMSAALSSVSTVGQRSHPMST